MEIRKAIKYVYKNLPDKFHGYDLARKAELLVGKSCDGSIIREFHKLRNDYPKIYNCECIDKQKSIYKKLS